MKTTETNRRRGTNKLSPSLLAADCAALGDSVKTVTAAGAHYIHFDIMDGRFVPNLSFGPAALKALRPLTALPFDTHLMLGAPLTALDAFAEAGADMITVHAEAVPDMKYCLNYIKGLGKKAGISLKPRTPVDAALPFAGDADMFLIMSVEPGFGGQRLLPQTLRKAEILADYRERNNLRFDIEMDGGICLNNVGDALNAGVNVVVAGTAVFGKTADETAANVRLFLDALNEG